MGRAGEDGKGRGRVGKSGGGREGEGGRGQVRRSILKGGGQLGRNKVILNRERKVGRIKRRIGRGAGWPQMACKKNENCLMY